jgi:hypothetical protein
MQKDLIVLSDLELVEKVKSGDMKQTGYFKKMISMQTERLKVVSHHNHCTKPVLSNLVQEMLNTEI